MSINNTINLKGESIMGWKTDVTELLDIKYPIVQGGLAHLAYADLAAAVSNAGGLGQITAMSLADPELLKAEIRKVKTLTTNPFGVNFAIGQSRRSYKEMDEVEISAEVAVIKRTGRNHPELLAMAKEKVIS